MSAKELMSEEFQRMIDILDKQGVCYIVGNDKRKSTMPMPSYFNWCIIGNFGFIRFYENINTGKKLIVHGFQHKRVLSLGTGEIEGEEFVIAKIKDRRTLRGCKEVVRRK